jgi:hypothetical protein
MVTDYITPMDKTYAVLGPPQVLPSRRRRRNPHLAPHPTQFRLLLSRNHAKHSAISGTATEARLGES